MKKKEEIVKMKCTYKKNKRIRRTIKKENICINRKNGKIEPLKLKKFNFNKLKGIERDPDENVNSKIFLLQSLIGKSKNKIKTYKENILSFNHKLNELCYESFNISDIINNNGEINNNININDDDINIENLISKVTNDNENASLDGAIFQNEKIGLNFGGVE